MSKKSFEKDDNEKPLAESAERAPELILEKVREFQSLDIAVGGDISKVLETLNSTTESGMKHREGGFHATIIGPAERKVLEELSEEQLEELKRISADLQNGVGIEIKGVGIIDGATANVPEKDREKKTSFIAIEVPALNAFRVSIGLHEKDLHITLGFSGGDIHYEKTGEQDEKGRDVLRPISKKANPELDYMETVLSDIRFAGLSGQEKQKKKEKLVDPKKEAKKKFKALLNNSGLGGKDLIELGVKPGPEMGKTISAIERSVKDGAPLNADISEDAKKTLEERIASVREKLED